MGDRYFVTGVQLRIIKALLIKGNQLTNIIDEEIVENQYLCNSYEFKKLKRVFGKQEESEILAKGSKKNYD